MRRVITFTALAALASCTGLEAEQVPATLGGKPAVAVTELELGFAKTMKVNVQQAGVSCATDWRVDNLAQTLPLSVVCSDGRFGKGTAQRNRWGFDVEFTLNDGTIGTTRIGPE